MISPPSEGYVSTFPKKWQVPYTDVQPAHKSTPGHRPGVLLCAYVRQHLPKKPHSSFSREAQSKLQNIAVPPMCISLARTTLL